MDIGKLDKRITLQIRSATLDDYGQELNSWSDFATVWANVKPVVTQLGRRETMQTLMIDTEATHTVAVRYDVRFMPPTLVAAWRIKYVTPAATRIFNITNARDLNEERKYVIFECNEGNEVGQ
jgi:SPP1 family predicted phage head-tail adaptor